MAQDPEYENVCRNIRYLRASHGLSRTAMAKKLHISIKTLDALESGHFPEYIGVNMFFHVQRIFGVHPKILLSVRLEDE